MNYVFDASALINLVNAGVLAEVLRLPGNFYFVGGLVEEESDSIRSQIAQAIEIGTLARLDDTAISAATYLGLLETYELGEGETECIAAALDRNDLIVVSDDRRARYVATVLLGTNRVTGTIGLLRLTVANGVLGMKQAFEAYQVMRSLGAFLPKLTIKELFPEPDSDPSDGSTRDKVGD